METNHLVVSPVLFVNGRVSNLQPIMGYLASHFLLTTIFHTLLKISTMTLNINVIFLILRELLQRCLISQELFNPKMMLNFNDLVIRTLLRLTTCQAHFCQIFSGIQKLLSRMVQQQIDFGNPSAQSDMLLTISCPVSS